METNRAYHKGFMTLSGEHGTVKPTDDTCRGAMRGQNWFRNFSVMENTDDDDSRANRSEPDKRSYISNDPR